MAALVVGGLYLGEVISNAEMIPLATTLGSLIFLSFGRSNDLLSDALFVAATSVALAILVSEQILDPMVLTPLLLGTPLYFILYNALPVKSAEFPSHADLFFSIYRVINIVSSVALASLLLFTNYLSPEGAAAIFLGSYLISNLFYSLAAPSYRHKVFISNVVVAAAVAALVFTHLLPTQHLIGASILDFSIALPSLAIATYEYIKLKSAPKALPE